MDNIEFKFKFYQIKKLDFSNVSINDNEMHFIFQYDLINLEYLNLENKKLSNKGIKALQNKSLKNLIYLNLSNNNITDEGLKYLNELSHLKELIILNMNKLSDDYFLSLQSFRLNYLKCDKNKLTLNYVDSSYNNFSLPNLTCLKLTCSTTRIHKDLKDLFPLDNICSRITDLDLSNTGITDNGMLRLIKNISVFKKLEYIFLENTPITIKSQKYIEQLYKLNIITIINNSKNKYQNKAYKICLGGSTISGKTTYINTYMNKSFNELTVSTIGIDKFTIEAPKPIDKKVIVFDTARWGGIFDSIVQGKLINIDGVLLLFDLSNKDDFKALPHCLDMISEYYELEDFPILLIGNKSDLGKEITDEEIKQFQKDNFIGYFEVSCRHYLNVETSLNFMINFLYENEKKFPIYLNNLDKNIKYKKGKK